MKALVVDDEPPIRDVVSTILRAEGWSVAEADTAEGAVAALGREDWGLVFCDVMLGRADGFEVLRRFLVEQPRARVVLMTGYGSASGAMEAVSAGAYDYLLKPFNAGDVRSLARSVRERLEGEAGRRSESHPKGAAGEEKAETLIGRSATFVQVMKMVARVAPTTLPVLVTGESGTGKEVVALELHRRSRRCAREFVAVNCGAVASELIESELFGHVRGSFTGADRDRAGLFEEADGGTVFLDEVTETSAAFQVKLLRVLQQGEIRRVGSNKFRRIDVRVIAATNRDPLAEVQQGRFRQDLLYRLNAVHLHLPALRERRGDILPLARHFIARAREEGQVPLNLSPEAASLLESYDWPGNVRELENVITHASALCDYVVRPDDLPHRLHEPRGAAAAEVRETAPANEVWDGREWPSLSEVESRYVSRVLAHTKGNKQAASRLLGVDRRTIERVMKRAGEPVPPTLHENPAGDRAGHNG